MISLNKFYNSFLDNFLSDPKEFDLSIEEPEADLGFHIGNNFSILTLLKKKRLLTPIAMGTFCYSHQSPSSAKTQAHSYALGTAISDFSELGKLEITSPIHALINKNRFMDVDKDLHALVKGMKLNFARNKDNSLNSFLIKKYALWIVDAKNRLGQQESPAASAARHLIVGITMYDFTQESGKISQGLDFRFLEQKSVALELNQLTP